MSTEPKFTLDWVDRKLAEHEKATADLRAMRRIIVAETASGASPVTTDALASINDVIEVPSARLDLSYGYKKRTLLQVIADSASGLTLQQVITAGTKAGLTDLNSGNTSPQLSHYRSKGQLELRDGVWRITPKGREILGTLQKKEGQP